MALRRRRKRNPWENQSALDAIRVARARRHEREGYTNALVETSEHLRRRLGFDTVDEMQAWADELMRRSTERLEETRRRRAAGENV